MSQQSTATLCGPGDLLPFVARQYGVRAALVTADRTLTFDELDQFSGRVAAGLAGLGVRPRERVSLYPPNCWEWVVAYHGALRAGAVVNPVNALLTAEELAFVLRNCQASAVFTAGARAEAVADLARDLPELRTVVAFGSGGDGVVAFGELLAADGAAPTSRSTRSGRARSATRRGRPGIRRGRCRAIARCS